MVADGRAASLWLAGTAAGGERQGTMGKEAWDGAQVEEDVGRPPATNTVNARARGAPASNTLPTRSMHTPLVKLFP